MDDDARFDTLDPMIPLSKRQLGQVQDAMADCMELELDTVRKIRALAKAFAQERMVPSIKDPDDTDKYFHSDAYEVLTLECIAKVRVKMGLGSLLWHEVFIRDYRSPLCTYADEIEATVMNVLKPHFNVDYEVKREDEM